MWKILSVVSVSDLYGNCISQRVELPSKEDADISVLRIEHCVLTSLGTALLQQLHYIKS